MQTAYTLLDAHVINHKHRCNHAKGFCRIETGCARCQPVPCRLIKRSFGSSFKYGSCVFFQILGRVRRLSLAAHFKGLVAPSLDAVCCEAGKAAKTLAQLVFIAFLLPSSTAFSVHCCFSDIGIYSCFSDIGIYTLLMRPPFNCRGFWI